MPPLALPTSVMDGQRPPQSPPGGTMAPGQVREPGKPTAGRQDTCGGRRWQDPTTEEFGPPVDKPRPRAAPPPDSRGWPSTRWLARGARAAGIETALPPGAKLGPAIPTGS